MKSDLLALRDFDGDEFIDRIAGLFRHCQSLSDRAAEIATQAQKRVGGINLNVFTGIAEIGEAFLRVQEARPGDFGDWFEAHQPRFGFGLRHAEKCKTAAAAVRQLGLEAAYAKALEHQHAAQVPQLRVPRSIENLPEARARELFDQLTPIYSALAERFGPAIA